MAGAVPLVHLKPRMDADRREIAFGQKLIKLLCASHSAHEDDNLAHVMHAVGVCTQRSFECVHGTLCSAMWACVDLVEIERIEQVIQLAILLRLLELDIVLLKAVQCQLALVVNVDLHRLRKPHSSSTTLPSLHDTTRVEAVRLCTVRCRMVNE